MVHINLIGSNQEREKIHMQIEILDEPEGTIDCNLKHLMKEQIIQ